METLSLTKNTTIRQYLIYYNSILNNVKWVTSIIRLPTYIMYD